MVEPRGCVESLMSGYRTELTLLTHAGQNQSLSGGGISSFSMIGGSRHPIWNERVHPSQ